jgi:hypothetical protein
MAVGRLQLRWRAGVGWLSRRGGRADITAVSAHRSTPVHNDPTRPGRTPCGERERAPIDPDSLADCKGTAQYLNCCKYSEPGRGGRQDPQSRLVRMRRRDFVLPLYPGLE